MIVYLHYVARLCAKSDQHDRMQNNYQADFLI